MPDGKIAALPFTLLHWEDFERLIAALACDADGLTDVRLHGLNGQAQDGVDVVGFARDGHRAHVYQCKKVTRFTESQLAEAIARFVDGRRPFGAQRLVIAVAAAANRTRLLETLEAARHREPNLELELWDAPRLDDLLRERPWIVERFFGEEAARRFCLAASFPSSPRSARAVASSAVSTITGGTFYGPVFQGAALTGTCSPVAVPLERGARPAAGPGRKPRPSVDGLDGAAKRDSATAGQGSILTAGQARISRELALPAMLPREVPQFTGREAELGRLAVLAGSGRVAVALVSGIAGVGKTSLAVRAAHLLLDRFPDGQLYADLRGYTEGKSPVAPAEVLGLFLRRLGLPAEDVPGEQEQRSDMFRGLLAGRRVLVLLDNANSEAQVRPLLPGAGQSLVLVTSRSRLPALEVNERIDLGVLPEGGALELLARLAGDARVAYEPDAASRVAHYCGRMPLALRIAGHILAEHPTWPLSRLEHKLADERTRLARLEVGDLQARTAFEASCRHLTDADARVFRLLGLHFSPDFDAASVAALADIEIADAGAALDRLSGAALITEGRPGRYEMHDLLRLFARDTCHATDDQVTRDAAEERLTRYYADVSTFLDYCVDPEQRQAAEQKRGPLLSMREALALLATDRHAFLAAGELAAQGGLGELMWRLGGRAYEPWHEDDLVTLREFALSPARRSGDTATLGRGLANLGGAYRALSRFDEAVSVYEHALRIFREQAPDRQAEVMILSNLGATFRNMRRYADAIATFRQALTIRRDMGNRHGEGMTLNDLGRVYQGLRQFDEAIGTYRQALAIHQESGNRQGEGQTFTSLGAAYQELGHYDEAIAAYQRALTIRREAANRRREGQILNNLGLIYQKLQQHEQAVAHFHEAEAAMRSIGVAPPSPVLPG